MKQTVKYFLTSISKIEDKLRRKILYFEIKHNCGFVFVVQPYRSHLCNVVNVLLHSSPDALTFNQGLLIRCRHCNRQTIDTSNVVYPTMNPGLSDEWCSHASSKECKAKPPLSYNTHIHTHSLWTESSSPNMQVQS